MATAQDSGGTFEAFSKTLRANPGLVLLLLVAVVLVVDLLARFAGQEIPLFAERTLGGELSFARFGSLVWEGIVIGLIFGLAGIGLSMTYSILNFANFSHGDLFTTGAFTGWGVALLIAGFGLADASAGYLIFVMDGRGPGPADVGASIVASPLAILAGVVMAAVATALVALFLDRVVYYPMRNRGGIPLLIASIGVALALRSTLQFVYGARTRGITDTSGVVVDVRDIVQPVFGDVEANGGLLGWMLDASINLHRMTLVVVAVVLIVALHLMLQRTKLGKAMRAMADNKDLALVTGIPTERVVRWTWILGAGLAGVAGYLYVLERGAMDFNLGWFLLLFIFAAVILGGIGSIYGAIAGGLVIGLVHEVSIIWISSDLNAAAAFAIMIVVLLYRPDGLFKGVTTA